MSAPRKLADANCALCRIRFRPIRAGQKCCSPNCADERRRKGDITLLAAMVASGETKAEMARRFNVSYSTIRRWVYEYGMQGTWREQRYA